ncbi:MAG: glutaminyl-peptide cyclotransferase [Acidimicrobiales bacterium]
MRRRGLVAVIAAAVVAAGCGGTTTRSTTTTTTSAPATASVGSAPVRLTLTVLARHPHDTEAFTEGLTFDDRGRLFESLGLDGRSEVREVDPAGGSVLQRSALAADQFGEGLAAGPSGLVQLTWKNGIAHTWSLDGLAAGPTMTYTGEGWGLTFDGTRFVQSDGSSHLTFRDRSSFADVGGVDVTRDGDAVDQLNELEWVDGALYANVWHSDEIMRIDPSTGAVSGVLDASSLWRDPSRTSEMTLNGIAHRPGDPANVLWLTGKNWPEIFQVRVSG